MPHSGTKMHCCFRERSSPRLPHLLRCPFAAVLRCPSAAVLRCPSASSKICMLVEDLAGLCSVSKFKPTDQTKAPCYLGFISMTFIQGCDGSILIDGANIEKTAFGHQGVQGFDVVQSAKDQLESVCPGVVSCAMSSGPVYQVPTGRRDGRVSNASQTHPLHICSQGQLRVGFYSRTCPNAENIVASVVRNAVATD